MTENELAGIIRDARTKAGYSQGTLSELAEYEQASLSQFERGKKHITLGAMIRLLDALGLKLKAGQHVINTAGELYGVIGSAMLKKHMSNKDLAEASGLPVTTIVYWTRAIMPGVKAVNALAALNALELDVSVAEA